MTSKACCLAGAGLAAILCLWGCADRVSQKGDDGMELQERTGEVTMKGGALTLLGTMPEVGDVAPDFAVVDASFGKVRLSDFRGKTVLLSAVPSLDTPVCSLQTKRFNDAAEKLPGSVVVLTISEDLPFAQARFCGAENIRKIKVLSDSVERDFGRKFGILIKENGLLARSVWVIGPGGKVTYRQVVPELTHEPDYDEALAAVK